MKTHLFALVDCNNFFVSCERVFRPDLDRKPVVVLSSNDGCVISRSQEVKDLGVPMGMPFFQCRELFKKHNVKVFSSNFSLYSDLSNRVMSILKSLSPQTEVYSIDEAFVELSPKNFDESYIHHIKKTIRQCTRIPVSIGVAPSKVLAKLGNHIAKKFPEYNGVCTVTPENRENLLQKTPIGEVWGIGRKSTGKLMQKQVYTAEDFVNLPKKWIEQEMKTVGMRIYAELQGISCLPVEESEQNQKSILCSRSFGRAVTGLHELQQAVGSHIEQAAKKLREQNLEASYLQVFFHTNWFNADPKHDASKSIHFSIPTAYTPTLLQAASKLVEGAYESGFRYAKAGVCLSGLVSKSTIQTNLFQDSPFTKERSLMASLDALNRRFGHNTCFYAGSGVERGWSVKQQFSSPRYTTCLSEIPVAK